MQEITLVVGILYLGATGVSRCGSFARNLCFCAGTLGLACPRADSLWLLIISGILQAARRQYLTVDGSRAGFSSKKVRTACIMRKSRCVWKACGKVSMSRLHVGIHSYQQQTFLRKSDLERHRRTHTGEKPFVCRIEGCEKAFAQKGGLKSHYASHSHAKNHMCPDCQKSFSDVGPPVTFNSGDEAHETCLVVKSVSPQA